MDEGLKKTRVLIMIDWYEPGFKAGGPIRSAVNFADQLESDLDIFVLTSDHDLGELNPYQDIETDQWLAISQHHVFYASRGFLSWRNLQKLIKEINADYIYLNSMFSRFFAIYPLLMKRLGKLEDKIVLAPRGMLKESALQHKSVKKKIFIRLFKTLDFTANVIFQATDGDEEKDIRKQCGNKAQIFKIGNLPGKQPDFLPPHEKKIGVLSMIFVGRVHPIKNLYFLLTSLQGIRQKIELTIVATLEDEAYWEKCNEVIRNLPVNISIKLLKDIPNKEIVPIIQKHHIFALPTKGENFGHSIFEALSAGRPVLISNQTPWRNLESAKAGWDIQLEDMNAFRNKLQFILEMDYDQLTIWCKGAWNYCEGYIKQSDIRKNYLKLFN